MKEIKITLQDDGSVMVDGAPVKGMDEAVAMLQETARGSTGESATEAPMGEELSPETTEPEAGAMPPLPEESAEVAMGEEPGAEPGEMPEDTKARYAKKKGMRPKEAASFDDYFKGSPRG